MWEFEIMHQMDFLLGHGTCLDVCDDVKYILCFLDEVTFV